MVSPPSMFYRLWRDVGFALGAILAGILADAFGPATAVWTIGVLTAISWARRGHEDVRDTPSYSGPSD